MADETAAATGGVVSRRRRLPRRGRVATAEGRRLPRPGVAGVARAVRPHRDAGRRQETPASGRPGGRRPHQGPRIRLGGPPHQVP